MYNRKTFFDITRRTIVDGAMRQSQVDGFNMILKYAEKHNINLDYLAYILATVWHETARTMQPIEEYGQGKGRAYGKVDPDTNQTYYGRGYVQLTWKRNYELASKKLGVDFVSNPKMVMEPKYALPILFHGMVEGWFTGKSLEDYIDGVDEEDAEDLREFIEARRVVNGTNVQKVIGNFALKFEKALRSSYQPNPKPLTKSRTAKGAGVTAISAVGMMVEPVKEFVSQVQESNIDLFSNNTFLIVIGVVGLVGAIAVFRARWDDAGRPLPWRKEPEAGLLPSYCSNCGEKV